MLAELSKILAAVTIAQSCLPIPTDNHSASGEHQLAENARTAAIPEFLGSRCVESPCRRNSRNAVQVNESMNFSRVRSEEESAVTRASAKNSLRVQSPMLKAQIRFRQAEPKAEGAAPTDSEAVDFLLTRDPMGLSAVNSIVCMEADMDKESAAFKGFADQEDQSVSDIKLPRLMQDLESMAQEKALADHEGFGQISDSTHSSLPQCCLSAAENAAGSVKANQLPRLASRAPKLRVFTSGKEVHLQHSNGRSKPASSQKQLHDVESDAVFSTMC